MADKRNITPPPRNTEPLKGNFFTRAWASWFEEIRSYINRVDSNASTSTAGLAEHVAGVGTEVHGLGNISTHDTSEFDPAGSASTVQTNLTTHINLTGSDVHGLGTISTHSEEEYATDEELNAVYDNSVHLQGTTPGTQQTGNSNISGIVIAGTSLKSPALSPVSDGTTALQVKTTGGTAFVNFDSTNQRVGIKTTAPAYPLDVNGAIGINEVKTISRSANGQTINIGTNGDNSIGSYCLLIGDSVGANSAGMTGQYNVAIGQSSFFRASTAGYSIAIGGYSLYNVESGQDNIGIGYLTLSGIVSGYDNVAIGHAAHLNGISSNAANTSLGTLSHTNLYGSYNTAVGMYAGAAGNSATQISYYQTSIGYMSGYRVHGINNTLIGYKSGNQTTNVTISNSLFIGAGAGEYETENNKVIVDNIIRSSESNQRENAPIYGVLGSYAYQQTLRLNARIGISVTSETDAWMTLRGDTIRAPLKLVDADLTTVADEGMLEYNGGRFWITQTASNNRRRIQTLERCGTSVTTNYYMTGNECVIVGESADPITVYLPVSTGSGLQYEFKNMLAGTMTIEANGVAGDLIDASNSKLVEQYEAYKLYDYAEGQWLILSYYTPPTITGTGDLLLETGDDLLLENGNSLQLEGNGGGGGVMATTLQDTYDDL